ncbi:MAG: 23S rRNA (uracil(1939)-C(5))-methyltransferase RlmD [Candidatus Cloacimonadaceae bacterium]|jgi:23S rRNA (uracil1939-C5)-methyltransferase|nr:23S rRNA (uracil(1939)-C(5))-methyltransferase RlmD [Candidatus Cloacimonadota bacterium]MDY0127639.1 23S rRNA (uracil(1939)-C(5))-methyltransferase RlmD [Candidatus Cloacimonadaceae bacterium]MCB5254390.1 23S rRNA (uracil(1939)-C(5))-methyltransferase RlmD [Candidatus Cloacimonadota bacterium]MCK9178194.1 23S rRNA (uracil(1939)-C(5))-methyltransferase RlmD [Candidatus Cloacimonadota bacterium]MCK9241994.1 23S rRNA (uracil(1939)-C(5))-methyltransferase RlmD [Candidatus Cloacimonadota bacteri
MIENLKIEKIAMGGSGLGFHEGRAIFVPNTAIGDVVKVEITQGKKDHAFARVLQYISRGEGVVEPGCEAFTAQEPCGGCDWLMLDYPVQLQYKEQLIRELFKDHEDLISGCAASGSQYHYRNKVYMPVGEGLSYGIFARYSHNIVPHRACRNHPPVFDEIADTLIELCKKAKVEPYDESNNRGCLRHIGLRCNHDASEVLLILVCRSGRLPFSKTIVNGITGKFPQIVGIVQNINRDKTNVILGEEEKLLFGRDYLQDRLSDLSFRIHYRSFWQVNLGAMENILTVMRAQMKKTYKVIDAYCGIGAIGLSLASEIDELVGIEEEAVAVQDAIENASSNGFANARFICGKFEDTLHKLSQEFQADVIILDPPRGGVQESALEAIRAAGIPKILYLSCAPMSLARDLKILMQDGRYELQALSSFDMFPNTWHIESLAVLVCKP